MHLIPGKELHLIREKELHLIRRKELHMIRRTFNARRTCARSRFFMVVAALCVVTSCDGDRQEKRAAPQDAATPQVARTWQDGGTPQDTGSQRLGSARDLRENCIPSDWSSKDMARVVSDEGGGPSDARVLVWQIKEDDRPLYVEQAIVWMRWEGENAKRWMLVNVFRHPRARRSPREWELAVVCDADGYAELREFDHPPNNADVYRFLEDTWWTFSVDHSFRLLDAAVCTKDWKEIIGEAPTKFYDEQTQEGS
jgi:hypothetical protein